MKKRENNNHFGYGPLILLMGACVAVMAAIVLTLVAAEDSDRETINMESTQSKTTVSESEESEASESADREEEGDWAEGAESQTEESRTTESQTAATQPEPPTPEISEPETYEFTVSDKSYFDDALFIGDSRTAGLQKYGTLDNADYFASAGLNLYTIERTKVETAEGKKIKLEEMLTHNTYGKVYIMLGINELGYDFDTTVQKYREFIDYIFAMQPDTILYVCANMHVNSLRNELDEIHNNPAINRMNEQIASFADQKNIFYLDINPLFDDEEGNLAQEYISDDTHLLGMYYETWCNWYCENTIVKQ